MVNNEMLEQAHSWVPELKTELGQLLKLKSNVPLYAPHGRADVFRDGEEFSATPTNEPCLFRNEPIRGRLDGKLSVGELIALILVKTQVRCLADTFLNFHNGGFGDGGVALDLNKDDYVDEVIGGMADFIQYLSYAAGIREMILRGEGRPINDPDLVYFWRHFEPAWCEDGFLGQATCVEVIRVVVENTTDIDDVESRRKGATLAANLYLALIAEGPEELVKKALEAGK